MTQIFKADGTVVPVTAVLATPNFVAQVKNEEGDGYRAVQVGFDVNKNLKKPQVGHLKNLSKARFLREFRITREETPNLNIGDVITVESFAEGDAIKVVGTSKGKGFQGVVKRHGFHGHPASHGHKDQLRMPGSIGAGGVQRVFKGVRMAGRMGNDQVTVDGLSVVAIDSAKDILYIKGALPGTKNSLLLISGPGELKVNLRQAQKPEEKIEVEQPVVEAVESATPTEEVASQPTESIENKQ